jgi:activating signal cointegrator complex subunit 3
LLNKKGIFTVQQLLDLPKANLQTVIGTFPASRLYQVWISL